MDAPITDNDYLLERFPGKGGWTYAAIPEASGDRRNPFGWLRVKGSIDSFAFEKYHMMPMGNGTLFLPVKATIRKQIRKNAGDRVHVVLYHDDAPLEIPPELEDCLAHEPEALSFFQSLKEGAQKEMIDWIYSARKEDTKAKRMVATIDLLLKKKTLRSK